MHLEDECSDIVKKAREGLGLSIRALADSAGVSPRTIVALESYKEGLLKSVADALSLSYEKLTAVYENTSMTDPVVFPDDPTCTAMCFEIEASGTTANAYIVREEEKKTAVLIDGIGASKDALHFIKHMRLVPESLLITHGHFDHTAGIEALKQVFPSMAVYLAGKDILKDCNIPSRNFHIQALTTPGHSEDAVCYVVNGKVMFVGDTIFAGSVGRPNYDYNQLLENIRNKIFTLPDNTILAPGHGPLTTVGEEKKNNPFF